MLRLAIRRLVLPLMACAALATATAAAAQNVKPALRANVTVAGDIVRIGDLVENAGPVADVPIFRAPDLGTRGAVAVERVLAALRPHQLADVDTRGLSEVIVTRSSRAIAPQEIAARIAQALEGQYGFGPARDILVTLDRGARTLHVESNATGELQVLALEYDPRTSRFDATLDLPSSAALHRQSTRFFGSAIATVDAIVVERPIERGETLKASDVAVERRPKAEGAAIADVGAVVGRAARHPLRVGQPLFEADLMKPMLVQRSDTVTIVYRAPGLTLTLRGQAQDAGALGDTISILNVQSKRVVQGVVSGPGRVSVAALSTRLVENAPQAAVSDLSSAAPQQQQVSRTE